MSFLDFLLWFQRESDSKNFCELPWFYAVISKGISFCNFLFASLIFCHDFKSSFVNFCLLPWVFVLISKGISFCTFLFACLIPCHDFKGNQLYCFINSCFLPWFSAMNSKGISFCKFVCFLDFLPWSQRETAFINVCLLPWYFAMISKEICFCKFLFASLIFCFLDILPWFDILPWLQRESALKFVNSCLLPWTTLLFQVESSSNSLKEMNRSWGKRIVFSKPQLRNEHNES